MPAQCLSYAFLHSVRLIRVGIVIIKVVRHGVLIKVVRVIIKVVRVIIKVVRVFDVGCV